MKGIALLCVASLAMLACSESGRTFRLPTTPTDGNAANTDRAARHPRRGQCRRVASDFTRIEVGQTIDRIIGDAATRVPRGTGLALPVLPLTAPASGTLTLPCAMSRTPSPPEGSARKAST